MKTISQLRSFGILPIALIAFGLCAPDAATAQSFTGHTGRGIRGGSVNSPQSTYMVDDGTAEDSVGLNGPGGSFIVANEFTISGGNNIITSISIAWGTPAFPEPDLNGLSYTAVLWSDPNGDGSPTDAVVLASAPGVIALQGTNTFLVSPIAPTMVTTTNFFVGYVITHTANQFPAALDETAPISNRSFIKVGNDPNNMTGSITIESAGLPGNWLVRADAVPEPQSWAMLAFGAMMLVGVRRLLRKSA